MGLPFPDKIFWASTSLLVGPAQALFLETSSLSRALHIKTQKQPQVFGMLLYPAMRYEKGGNGQLPKRRKGNFTYDLKLYQETRLSWELACQDGMGFLLMARSSAP